MASTDQMVGEPKPIQKEYTDIIKSESPVDKKFVEDTGLPAKIVYYCRTCKKLVNPKRIGKKFQFSCSVCNGVNVAFGSDKSIRDFYRLPNPDGKISKR
ncbi:hypothetical protein HZA44_03510 [Candidatus Peregrinibacteria bacterium]|nr:hypothetical protein [Candidatus Peregrinibacteria bacterium]